MVTTLLILIVFVYMLCSYNSEISYISNVSVTLSKMFAYPFSAKDASLMDATLREFTLTLENANVTYFMIGGTLLGSYRHHGRIPWDDDIDVAVNYANVEQIKALFRYSTTHTFYPGNRWFYLLGCGMQAVGKFFANDGHVISGQQYRSPFIDVFWYDENECYVFFTRLGYRRTFLKNDVFPLRRRPFGKFFLPVPCNTTAYLTAESIEVEQCKSRHWNHLNEKRLSVLTVPCTGTYLPFR